MYNCTTTTLPRFTHLKLTSKKGTTSQCVMYQGSYMRLYSTAYGSEESNQRA